MKAARATLGQNVVPNPTGTIRPVEPTAAFFLGRQSLLSFDACGEVLPGLGAESREQRAEAWGDYQRGRSRAGSGY